MSSVIQIHETAFVTAAYRASNEELSKDIYASLWKNPKTNQWIERYVREVSMEEPFVHCLRNRYWYETIRSLVEKKEVEVLINFGCGFSMYPFLFEEELVNIEIDQLDLIEYKKKHIQGWIQAGKLPDREIHYLAKDFNLQKEELAQAIVAITQGRSSFILLEGVLFFLNKASADSLIDLIGRVQTKGSYFGSVSFVDEIVDTACFSRLVKFCQSQVAANSSFECLTLPTSYYESLPNYGLVEQKDYVILSKKFDSKNRIENGASILNENMYLLRKK